MTVKRTSSTALLTILLGIAALGCLLWLASAADTVSGDAALPSCCPRIVGDQFFVSDKRYLVKGVNYYEKDHAWDRFWPSYCDGTIRESVAHELDLARDLGVNTLRIFLRWEFFTTGSSRKPTVPVSAKQCLNDLLDLATARQIKVLPTLLDGMPNEGTGSLYKTPDVGIAHVDSLLGPFTNTQGIAVDFSTDCRILAWDVKNEPDRDYERDTDGDGVTGTLKDVATVQRWVEKMIEQLRARDACHPITVGIYGAVDNAYDPTITGYYADTVDFLSMHYSLDERNFPADIDAIEAIAGGKPVVIEEFGLHTWADHPTDTHRLRDQAAHFNAILATTEADHLAGAMFWTLIDFSYVVEGDDERQRHQGILHNATVTTTEVPAPTDYGEKPAAAVIREHFKSFVAYLDTFDGYVAKGNCTSPLGWTDNFSGGNGATIIACDPLSHTFAPHQIGQARLTKWAGPDGVITSPVLEAVDASRSPQLILDVLTYTVRIITDNVGPVNLDLGVRATDEPTTTWLVADLAASGVDSATGWMLPQTVYAPLPAGYSAAQDFQIVLRLQDHVSGDTGYSAGFELGSAGIGACPSVPALNVRLKGWVQGLFGDEFNGRAIDRSVWDIVHGDPYLLNCGLVLTATRVPGVLGKTEVRSHRLFEPTSMLVISATTQNWQTANQEGDTSFGFERWDAHCHNAVLVTSNGHLALIRPEEGANCSQPNPETRECYLPIGDWEALRTKAHQYVIFWTPTQVTLNVDGLRAAAWDDRASTGCSIPAIPQVPLHVRLNANVFHEDRERRAGENHYDQDVLQVDYVYVPHVVALPIVIRIR